MIGRKDAFWKQYVAAIVLAVVFGAAVAASGAGLLDRAFEGLMADLLGPEDEYTLIVHVRAPVAAAAAEQLAPLLAELERDVAPSAAGPIFGLRRGVTVAGNANFFVTIPEPFVTTELLERMPVALQQLTGFNGHTWLLEPSVTVTTPEFGARDAVAEHAEGLNGVRAVVRHGRRVTIVMAEEERRDEIVHRLEQWLDNGRVVQLAWPEDTSLFTYARTVATLEDGLDPEAWQVLGGQDPSKADPMGRVAAALASLPMVWEQLTDTGASTEAGLRQLIHMLDELEPLLAAVDGPEVQAERLSDILRGSTDSDGVKRGLFQVVVSMAWQSLTGDGTFRAQATGEGEIDPAAVGGETVLDRWNATRHQLEAAAAGAARLTELSDSDPEAVSEAMHMLGQLLPGSPEGKTGLSLLVSDAALVPSIEAILQRELGDTHSGESPVDVFVSPPGAVEPNPRAVLAGLLRDVRRAVAGVFALIVAGAVLVLDHAVVFAAWPRLASVGTKARRGAMAVGGLLFGATYALAGGAMPLPGPGNGRSFAELIAVVLLGAVSGLIVHRLAPRISPVDEAELLAGRSLGLADGQLLQEIVIPRGRPGLLTFLNKFRQQFN